MPHMSVIDECTRAEERDKILSGELFTRPVIQAAVRFFLLSGTDVGEVAHNGAAKSAGGGG